MAALSLLNGAIDLCWFLHRITGLPDDPHRGLAQSRSYLITNFLVIGTLHDMF